MKRAWLVALAWLALVLFVWAIVRSGRERPVVATWPDEPVQPWDARTVTLARPIWGYGGGLN